MAPAIVAQRLAGPALALAAVVATAVEPRQMQVDSTKETEDKELQASLEETARRTLRQRCNDAMLGTASTPSDPAALIDAALAAALLSLAPDDPEVLMARIVRAGLEWDIDRRAWMLIDAFDAWRAATNAIPPGDLSEDLSPTLAAAEAAVAKVQSKLVEVERRLKPKLAELRDDAVTLLRASVEALEQDLSAAVELALILADLERRAVLDTGLGIALHVDRRTYARTLSVLVTLYLETNRIDEAEQMLRQVYRLQESSDTFEERFIEICLRGDLLLRRRVFGTAHQLFSNLLQLCYNDYQMSIVIGSIAAAEFGLGHQEEGAALCRALLGLSLDSTAPMASNETIGCGVHPSVHRDALLHAMHCATRPTSATRSMPDDAAPAPGTPPPAVPTSAAATAPATPDTDAAAIAAAAIAAAAAELPAGWVPDHDELTGMVYASSPVAPYTDQLGPKQLLDVCIARLGAYVLRLSKGGGPLSRASPMHTINVALPFAMPRESTNFVSAATVLPGGGDSADLSPREYSAVMSGCMAALAQSTVLSLRILVGLLAGNRDANFAAWSQAFGVLAVDIANTMSRAAELKSLFERAGYRDCFLKHTPPGEGFQQLDIEGVHSTRSDERVLVATILVVIPQPAGNQPCRRVADCLSRAKALASRSGTWIFVVVIDVGKLRNNSNVRSFGTPPAS